jgi:hypothetical protein
MSASWKLKEEYKKEQDTLEAERAKYEEQQQRDKFEAKRAKDDLALRIAGKANTVVQEILKLEDLIADRETGQPDPTWRVSLKEQELLDDLEKLEDYYASQRIMMRENCERRVAELYKKRDNEIEKIEKKARDEEERLRTTLDVALQNRLLEEKPTIEKRKAKIAALSPKKDGILENQKIPVSLKKMKRELEELKLKFPTIIREWEMDFPKEKPIVDIPTDYKEHRMYKAKRNSTESNNKVVPEKPGQPPTEKQMLGGGISSETPPPPKKMKPVEPQPPASEKPLSSPPIVRKKKTVAIAENASGSMFNGINIISSAKRPEATFTVIVPGKKWIDYSSEERSRMSHYDAYTLEFDWKAELAAEKERKDREWKAKLSKEEDEAEADAIRDMRKAEEAEKEWELEEED